MTITAAEMSEKMLSLDDLVVKLQSTEPLSALEFQPDEQGDKVTFGLSSNWNVGAKNWAGTELVDAVVSVNGKDHTLTKDALLQATSSIGLQRDYVLKTPGSLVQENLNYWYAHMPTKSFNLLTVPKGGSSTALALTKGSTKSVSNLALLEQAIGKLKDKYGKDVEIWVDYKLHHDLRLTQFRLIVPEQQRVIKSERNDGETDTWSLGLEIQNSLTAEAALRERGYMFAWWCTNGATSTHATSGTFSRKGNPDEESALEWTSEAIDNILEGLEHELDSVQALTSVKIQGEVNDTLQDVFERYRVPAQAREGIIAQLVESEDLTMYGVMAAITAAANDVDLSPAIVSRLLEVGGDLPAATSGRCDSCHRLPIG